MMRWTVALAGFVILAVMLGTLAGCDQVALVTPESTPVGESGEIGGYAEFVAAVRAEGATLDAAEEIEQPFFPVTGQLVQIDGASVQVFEFESDAARQQVSDTISEYGDEIGTYLPSWLDQPNFWARGQLIVLYVGQDAPIIELLTGIMGKPITKPRPSTDRPPEAILEAQKMLAAERDVPVDEIRIIEIEQAEWPDGCLGLGGPDEACDQVITPGWRAIMEVDSQRYEVRTDETGSAVRWQPYPYPPEAVLEAQQVLADELGVPVEEIQIVDVEQADWPDGCLGLGAPDEACDQVITPGWRAIMEADSQRYQVRTDETGSTVRWRPYPPEAVLQAQQMLADELGVPVGQVQIADVEEAEWPDGCLGLGAANEGCILVITPGWRAIMRVDGQRYEVRTDETGSTVRWQELSD